MMRPIESVRPLARPVSGDREQRQLSGAIATICSWLAGTGLRPLAITGPVGIGKTTLLGKLADYLDTVDGLVVVQARLDTVEAALHLTWRVNSALKAASRSGSAAYHVLVLDDLHLLPAADQASVLSLQQVHRGVRIITTATRDDRLGDVISVPLHPLSGSVGSFVTDPDELESTEVGMAFLQQLRERDPAFTLDRSCCSQVARICASAFGIPSEIKVLAGLVDHYGIAAVSDAVTEPAPRHYLGELLGEMGLPRPALTADAMVVLASIFASPGGASIGMLRQSLPRCDIDTATSALVETGLVFDSREPDIDERRGFSSRYHLRISAMGAASWCASQTEVSLAAIRHSHADYLHAQVLRMSARFYNEGQRAVFAEFQQELPNLRCTISDLVGVGRFAQAVALMSDALPLLARTCGMQGLLPDLLRVIREYEPSDQRELGALAMLAVRVFIACGEHEAASMYFEHLSRAAGPVKPYLDFLGVVIGAPQDRDKVLGTLASCVAGYRDNRDMDRLLECATEYLAHLVQVHRYDTVEAECRALLSEATRCGDDYAAGVFLLWRAVAACAHGGGEGRLYVERALAKLRPLGQSATLAALTVLLDNRHLRNLSQSSIDLAMVLGALRNAEFARPAVATPGPTATSDVEERLANRMGVRTVQKWAAAGASSDVADMLGEMLQRRYVDNLAGVVELRRSGLSQIDRVDPAQLSMQSKLTARESEVTSLVALGLTNKQVGFRLGISEWTVINHLRQVMRKLDCTSRVQVARWVSELDVSLPATNRSMPLVLPQL